MSGWQRKRLHELGACSFNSALIMQSYFHVYADALASIDMGPTASHRICRKKLHPARYPHHRPRTWAVRSVPAVRVPEAAAAVPAALEAPAAVVAVLAALEAPAAVVAVLAALEALVAVAAVTGGTGGCTGRGKPHAGQNPAEFGIVAPHLGHGTPAEAWALAADASRICLNFSDLININVAMAPKIKK